MRSALRDRDSGFIGPARGPWPVLAAYYAKVFWLFTLRPGSLRLSWHWPAASSGLRGAASSGPLGY